MKSPPASIIPAPGIAPGDTFTCRVAGVRVWWWGMSIPRPLTSTN